MSKTNGLMSPSTLVTMLYDCEAKGYAEWCGEYKQEPTQAMMLGSLVDALSQGEEVYQQFLVDHPELCKQRGGGLKAEYTKAYNDYWHCTITDPVWHSYLTGEKQKHLTGVIDGVPFHGFTDFIDDTRIVDLKYTKDIHPTWQGVSWTRTMHHDVRMAIYRELAYQMDGIWRECYLAPLTKETPYDHDIIRISDLVLSDAMDAVHGYLPRLQAIINGEVEPDRCGKCEFCRSTKRVIEPKDSEDITL